MMRNYNRFIPGEEIGDIEQWHFGTVSAEGVLGVLTDPKNLPVSDEKSLVVNDAIKQEGYAEGFIQGHAQALLETQKQIADYIEHEGREQAQKFSQLIAALKLQLAASEQVMAEGVLTLACEIARQILIQEISVNVNAVKPVIDQGLSLLLEDGRHAKIRLNPIDYDALKARMPPEYEELDLLLVADPLVAAGGCLIESKDTVVDGRIEKRWSRTLASLGLHADWELVDES